MQPTLQSILRKTELMYIALPLLGDVFGQCSPKERPELARRKVKILYELTMRYNFVQWSEEPKYFKKFIVSSPSGKLFVVTSEMFSEEVGVWPIYKWSEPIPLELYSKFNWQRRFLYYPKSGEIWDNSKLLGNYDVLCSDRKVEAHFKETIGNTVYHEKYNTGGELLSAKIGGQIVTRKSEVFTMTRVREDFGDIFLENRRQLEITAAKERLKQGAKKRK